MHDYAVFDHDRSVIGRWLGLGAVLIAGAISQLMVTANQLTGWDVLTKATLTTGAVYFALHWVFNRYLWKLPFFKIPDLNGTWLFEGQTLNEEGAVKYSWEGEIGIEQSWKCILLHLKTQNSQSHSYTATISKKYGPCGGWRLSYSYRNDPEIEQIHELASHKGFCEIEFDNALSVGKAAYFNSAGRRTFGVMTLRRKQP